MSLHLQREELLCYLDGEMPWIRRIQCRRHLRSCWSCRTELEKLEATIRDIVVAQESVPIHRTPTPPQAWPSFQSVIAQQQPSVQPSLAFFGRWSFWWKPTILAVGILSTAVAIEMRLAKPEFVSAMEVIQHVQHAEEQREQLSAGHVILQRVRITHSSHTRHASSYSEVNAWKSETKTVWEPDAQRSAMQGLQQAYAAYGIPDGLPLEGKALNAWIRVAGGTGSARKAPDGIVLDYGDVNDDTLPALELHIEPDAWTVHEMQLTLHGETYNVSENAFSMLPLDAVPPNIQALLSPAVERPIISMQQAGLPALSNAQIKQAELNVIFGLHRIQADLGDPVIIRSDSRGINVGVWQLPAERQLEVIAALDGISDVTVSAVAPRMRITTPAADASSPATEIQTGIQSPAPLEIAPQALKLMGGVAGEQRFAAQALSKFDAVIAQIYAMNNLAERFDSSDEATLSDEAKSQLQTMIRDHAGKVSASLSDLQNAMVPLTTLYGSMSNDANISPALVSGTWQSRSRLALHLARQADGLLRGILTSSTTPVDPHLGIPAVQKQLSSLAADVLALQAQK